MTWPGSAGAIGETESEDGEYSLEAVGAARLTGAYLHFRDMPPPFEFQDDGLLTTVMRLVLNGDLGPTTSYEVNTFADLSRTPTALLGGTFASVGSIGSRSPYRTEQLTWNFWEQGSVAGRLGVDRFRFDIEAAPVLLTAGRFPINYSVTNIFTPNDFFAPFSATAINTVYKPGVDAARLLLEVGELSGIEFVQVMGYRSDGEPRWGKSAALLRANTVLWDFEWALLGGKLAERWIAGGSVQGEIGPIGLRGEGHAGFADVDGDGDLDDGGVGRDEVHARLAAGFEVPFEWQNAFVACEYGFISDGTGEPASYVQRALTLYPDDQLYAGKHYVGASARAEIIPILQAMATGLFNPRDQSGLATIALLYNIADEADFIGGVMLPWGARPTATPQPPGATLESEFGQSPFTAFAESRFYF